MKFIQNAVAVDKVQKLVQQMTDLIAESGANEFDIHDANYTVGYLQSMLVYLACKNPAVLNKIIDTIDVHQPA